MIIVFTSKPNAALCSIGPTDGQRVWVCQRTDSDRGVWDVIVELGELPELSRTWIRFIDPARATTDSLFQVTISDADTFRLAVPSIERIGLIFQNESDSRSRFFTDILITGTQSFDALMLN